MRSRRQPSSELKVSSDLHVVVPDADVRADLRAALLGARQPPPDTDRKRIGTGFGGSRRILSWLANKDPWQCIWYSKSVIWGWANITEGVCALSCQFSTCTIFSIHAKVFSIHTNYSLTISMFSFSRTMTAELCVRSSSTRPNSGVFTPQYEFESSLGLDSVPLSSFTGP